VVRWSRYFASLLSWSGSGGHLRAINGSSDRLRDFGVRK
jgi:hypothetical protein